jgi:hypothetical protein
MGDRVAVGHHRQSRLSAAQDAAARRDTAVRAVHLLGVVGRSITGMVRRCRAWPGAPQRLRRAGGRGGYGDRAVAQFPPVN